jgi:hypothetical protein
MKKVFLVCVAVIALAACKSESKIAIDTSIKNNPILKEIQFDSDGVATRTIDCRFAEWMMYEPRGEDDTTTHEFPSSCIVIIIENDTIDIPFDDSISSTDLNENDSIRISYNVYRDKVGYNGRPSPYILVTKLERIIQ